MIKQLINENQKLKDIINEQDGRIEMLEREIRKNNIVIQGVVDKDEEGPEEVKEKVQGLLAQMGVEIDAEKEIMEIVRLGKFKIGKKRPILVKLQKWSKKLEIVRQTKNLKGSDFWIDDDYPKKIQEEKKTLIP